MYYGAIPHDRIIDAFSRHVPGVYVRDYREQGGFIVICKDYRTIKWGGQTTTTPVYRQVPATTLCNLPRGNVTQDTKYISMRLDRPGWRLEFRRAASHLTTQEMRHITKQLKCGEVFQGIV